MSLGDRLIGLGGARVTGALALACLLLIALLLISATTNVLQFRGKATAVGQVLSQLAAAEAKAAAEISSCADINTRQAGAVQVLEAELLQCRGAEQDTTARLNAALRQRDRARRAVEAEIQQRQTTIEQLVKTHESCAPRPLCRAVSDELLGTAANRPAE